MDQTNPENGHEALDCQAKEENEVQESKTQNENKQHYQSNQKTRAPNIPNWLVAAATIAIAVTSYFQWVAIKDQLTESIKQSKAAEASAKAAQDALKLTRENFILDQRPYIWLSKLEPEPSIAVLGNIGKRIAWNWNYSNYGKSAALKVNFDVRMVVGKDAIKQVHTLPNSKKPVNVLPPGKTDWSTAISPNEATEEDLRKLLSIDGGIVVFGDIYYTDTFRIPYHTEFCFYKLRGGGVAWCSDHNSID